MTTTSRAPICRRTYCAVADAPPLPKTSAFLPRTSAPLDCTSMEKP